MKHQVQNSGFKSGGGLAFGLVLVIIGIAMFVKQMNPGIPQWLFSWPMILVAIGIVVGFSTKFKDFGWFVLIALGVIFLADDIFPGTPVRNFIWPGFFLLLGLLVIFNQRSKRNSAKNYDEPQEQRNPVTTTVFSEREVYNNSSLLDTAAVFGGVKQRVVSKDFKGGEIVAVFGGAEINLTQADIQHPIELEITTVCGGVKLVVPVNWKVNNESAVVFGGIDDKRPPSPEPDPQKLLTIKGTCIFGGIEIRSF